LHFVKIPLAGQSNKEEFMLFCCR